MDKPAILYCHCQYAQVVPKDVKDAVLRRLCESGAAFDAVADLCEMSARRDPALKQFAGSGTVKIAACFPRAVKGLFHQCDADLSADKTEVLNMRTLTADEICARLAAEDLLPNLPVKAVTTTGGIAE
jgi:tRNA A37 threonylcarbamoyltransferase TsaD